MSLLSEHFEQSEFEKDSPLPPECVPVYTFICQNLLEPIRAQFDEPMDVTSGYRPPYANVVAHGASRSEHVATANWGAVDFVFASMKADMRRVFDYIRNSQLQFHQVILEHGANGTDIIHISYNKLSTGRQALEGAEFNRTPYTAWPVAA